MNFEALPFAKIFTGDAYVRACLFALVASPSVCMHEGGHSRCSVAGAFVNFFTSDIPLCAAMDSTIC